MDSNGGCDRTSAAYCSIFAQHFNPLCNAYPMTVHSVVVVRIKAEHGRRLDNFLLTRLRGVPRSRIYRMLRRGEVRVNGSRVGPHYRLQWEDAVRIPPHRAADQTGSASISARALDAVTTALRDAILHEDENLLVVDKPAGVAVHGGSGVSLGVIEALRRMRGEERYELAHRIDRDTSGCLAVAKNRQTLLDLHAQFRTGRVGKRYDAIVAGCWPECLRRVEKPLLRFRAASGERRVRVDGRGDPARTDFAVVRRLSGGDDELAATWLAVFPKTGRTHQIRVHASASGHPVLGDDKYARDEPRAFGRPRLLLHATELTLHAGGHRQRFSAPVPAAFEAFARRFD